MSLEPQNAKIMSNAFSKSILSDLLKTGKSKKFDLILNSISTNYKIFPFFTTHLPKSLFSESLFCLNVLATRCSVPEAG